MPASSHVSRRQVLSATAALGAGVCMPVAMAQTDKWPNKTIRIVVAFPPGGLTDAYARMYAEQLTAKFGVAAVVDNKPGGGAIIAIDAVAKAPADGYTLLMTTSGTVWQNRVLYTKLPYNLDKDLTPIANFPSGPLVVAVSEKVPARNMREFIEFAKTNTTSMGTYAPGSYPHMVADQTNRDDGTKILSVHYRGESPMWIDVASGQTQIAIGSYQAFATVQGRGVRAIGVTGTYRSPKLPDVPTLVEQGVAGRLVSLEGGLPLMAPAGTPQAVLQALSRVVVEGANSERAAKLRESFAIPNKPKNLEETRRDWERDVPVWIKQAVDLGLKLD
jgi:tripartite-type tricarboxylate transporter receptor subunit TctC